MSNRLFHSSLCLIPARCSQMEERHLLWLGHMHTSQEYLAKEGVKAIPPSLFVQRHYKEVRALRRFQHLLAGLEARCSSDGLADGGIHVREDRRLEQKVLDGDF